MGYKFSGKKLDECLSKAERRLSTTRKNFRYRIIEEEKGIFRKYCAIEVELKEEEKEEEAIKDVDKIIVTDNKIMLKMAGEAEMNFSQDIKIKINEEDYTGKGTAKVKASDVIRYECENDAGQRNMNISVSKDKMEVRLSIEYIPEKTRKVIGNFICKGKIELTTELVDGKLPPLYTKEDILAALKEKGIVYGIIEQEIDKAIEQKQVVDLVVAKGLEVQNDEEDKIKFLYEKTKRNVEADSNKNVDYKNLYVMDIVEEGDIIGELVQGKCGHDGVNVLGQEVKRKGKKLVTLTVKEGCKIEGNKVVATLKGSPKFKKGIFSVNKVLETNYDIDIKSGNINFIGDVIISGSVKDGMKVESGNSVQIQKNVESAQIIAQGEISVQGSIINSELIGGADTLGIKDHIEFLKKFKREIELIIKSVKEVRARHIISEDKHDGEIIKLLLETKFKEVESEAKEILKNNDFENETMDKIKLFLREKIIGSGSLGIKYYDQLFELIKCIDNEIEPEMNKISCPVDIYFNYCQDTKIKTTGNIFVTGKGQYVSDLSTEGDIEFLKSGAVARGGTLAGKNIKAKVVGSVAGVTTTLKVPNDGTISVDVAYQNSVFIVGDRQYLLENPSKDVKAYMDSKGEIIVDKLLL